MATVEELQAQLEGAQARITELNSESKGHRLNAATARTEAETARAEAIAAIKKESDRATAADARATEATTAAKSARKDSALRIAAKDAGIVDLDGLKLLDTDLVTVADDGTVTIPDKYFDTAKAAKPWLFGTPSTSSTTKVPDPKTAAAKLAKDMTPAERAAGLRALGVTGRFS